jgi:hypothetical protein
MLTRRSLFRSLGGAVASTAVVSALPTIDTPLAPEPTIESIDEARNSAFRALDWIAANAVSMVNERLLVGNLVVRNFDPVLAQPWDTINIPVMPLLASHAAGPIRPFGNARITLDKHIESTFEVPDITVALDHPELLRNRMLPCVVALAECIETSLLKLHTHFTPVGTPGSLIDEGVIDAAETALFRARVPLHRLKFLVIGAADYGAARDLPRFREFRVKNLFPMRHGFIFSDVSNGTTDLNLPLAEGTLVGCWKGILLLLRSPYIITSEPIVRAYNLAETGTVTVQRPVGTRHNLAFAREAIGLITRRLPQITGTNGSVSRYSESPSFGMRVVMGYNPKTLAQQFTLDLLYGCGVLREGFGVQVNS